MSEHKIVARHSGVKKTDRLFIPLIKRCVWITLNVEGVDVPCEISVLITNNKEIRKLNKEFRGIDKSTDVLSFPMHVFLPGRFSATPDMIDLATGLLPLGEIVISAERVGKQAHKLMHTRERETVYLTIHSVLHLLGYDHYGDETEARNMRESEKRIMWELGYSDD
ncbi:MAG: rRNA maturation RNase YbeY [Oscillospiraceae bacterium]|nr:rRNA maturation RNase YbeY [Oscillospiraceae bacterium]